MSSLVATPGRLRTMAEAYIVAVAVVASTWLGVIAGWRANFILLVLAHVLAIGNAAHILARWEVDE